MVIVQSDERFGERVLYLREMVKRSREYFYEKFQFSPATIRKWENLELKPVKVNLNKFNEYIAIYEDFLGIKVSANWVLYGEGEGPSFIKNLLLTPKFVVDLLFQEQPLFFYIDLDMRIQEINPKYASFFYKNKNTTENLFNIHLAELINEEAYKNYLNVIDTVLRTGKSSLYKLKTDFDDKTKLLLCCKPLYDNYNKIIGIFNFIEGEYKL